jgi:hypothetical protein
MSQLGRSLTRKVIYSSNRKTKRSKSKKANHIFYIIVYFKDKIKDKTIIMNHLKDIYSNKVKIIDDSIMRTDLDFMYDYINVEIDEFMAGKMVHHPNKIIIKVYDKVFDGNINDKQLTREEMKIKDLFDNYKLVDMFTGESGWGMSSPNFAFIPLVEI